MKKTALRHTNTRGKRVFPLPNSPPWTDSRTKQSIQSNPPPTATAPPSSSTAPKLAPTAPAPLPGCCTTCVGLGMPVDATVPLFPPAPPVLFVPVPVPDGAVAIVVGSSPPAAEEVVVVVGISSVTPLSRHRSWAKAVTCASSSGEQASRTTGRSEARKASLRQMHGMSVSWQPVLVKDWRAGPEAHWGMLARDWAVVRVVRRKGRGRRRRRCIVFFFGRGVGGVGWRWSFIKG